MKNLELTIPLYMKDDFLKLAKKAKRNIDDLSWSIGNAYKKVYHHYMNDGDSAGLIKMTHEVIDVVIELPDVNDWRLVATIVDGNLFVTDMSKKLVLRNGHGTEYKICDVCKHPTWKKFYIIRNTKTDEELQVGAECARKFGIGLVDKIYKFTNDLYKSFIISFPSYGDEEPIWPSGQKFHDPHAVRSVETSAVVIAAKKYYDANGGIWKRGYYEGRTYYPSESAAEIKVMLEATKPNDEDGYYKDLVMWLNECFEPCAYNDFDESIARVGKDFYLSACDVASAFFAIKKFELWKKEKTAENSGIYIPHRNDYIRIEGMVVSKVTKEGYYGTYTEYEIKNDADGNIYRRTGTVNVDENDMVRGYAIVNDVFNGTYTLGRITKNAKKGVKIDNELK